MLTPIRFRDGGDGLERELLASVDSDQAPSESRARVALQLGLVSVASAAASSNTAAASPSAAADLGSRWLRWSSLKKVLLVGAVTTAAIVAGVWLRALALPQASVHAAPAASSPPAPLAPEAPSPKPQLAPELAPQLAQQPEVQPAPAAQLSAPVARSTPRALPQRPSPRPVAPGNRLLAEVAQLDRVRAELRAERVASALSELDAYDAKFPTGELELEAAVLRVQALASQDRSAAVALARRTLERPGSERYRTELQRALASYPRRERSRTAP